MINKQNSVEQMFLDIFFGSATSNMFAKEQTDYPHMMQINTDENPNNNLRESAKSADSIFRRTAT